MREDKTLFLCVFRDEYLPGENLSTGNLSTEQERKSALRDVFGGLGWECAEILAALEQASGIYFDQVSQIRMDRWTTGRTALVGDAAACVSLLAGEGTGLAMFAAYVLAGELRVCGGDHRQAFARYQERLMPLLERKQKSAAKFASSFAPKSACGIEFRNLVTRLMGFPFVADFFLGRALREVVAVPDYGY
jgi:2-polyprenyl-6-methoxyphenol hydroxylase-like FAD-dependent oxidoreductase